MRAWPGVTLAILLGIAVSCLLGCKGRPAASPPEATAAEEQKPHGDDNKPDEDRPVADVNDVLGKLGSASAQEQTQALSQLQFVKSAADREKLRSAIRKLTSADNLVVQAAALGAYAAWAAQDAEPFLRAAASPHPAIRIAAAGAMRAARLEQVRDTLTRLKSDPDSTVAAAAAATLGDLLAASKGDDAIDALIADLGNQTADRSAQAGMKLEQMGRGNRRVAERLMAALGTSRDPAHRMSCVVVLGLTCAGTSPGQEKFAARTKAFRREDLQPGPADARPVPLLIKVLDADRDPMVREAAAEALGFIGSAQAAPALGKALRDPDADVRRRAASALIVVPPDAAKDELTAAAARDSSPEVRRFAVEAMAGLASADRATLVAQALRDPSAEVRRYAAEVLARTGTAEQTDALLPLFEDPDEDVRWKAVAAVAKFGDPRARQAFMTALWDPSARVALAAEEGLHTLGIGARVLTESERGGLRAQPTP